MENDRPRDRIAAAREVKARLKAGKSAYSWDDPNESAGLPNNEPGRPLSSRTTRRDDPPFYDREALQDKMRTLLKDTATFSKMENELTERLACADKKLVEMREAKCKLSAAKEMADSSRMRDRLSKSGKSVGVGGREHVQEEKEAQLTEFAAQDRIMALELLNTQLRKGQSQVEAEMQACEAKLVSAKEELSRAKRRLLATPKRFTQSLRMVQENVENLLQEKLQLEEVHRRRKLEDEERLLNATKRLPPLKAELDAVLDDIEEAEDDSKRWEQCLLVEKAQADALVAQRKQAILDLQQQHGEDALELAAFSMSAADYARVAEKGAGEVGYEVKAVLPVARVAEALRPCYAPLIEVTDEDVRHAVHATGANVAEGGFVDVNTFCSIGLWVKRQYSLDQ